MAKFEKLVNYLEDVTGLDIDGACHKAKGNSPEPLSRLLQTPALYYLLPKATKKAPFLNSHNVSISYSHHDQTTSRALSQVTARWAVW